MVQILIVFNNSKTCVPGLIANTFIWSPQRSPAGCVAARSSGTCLQCQNGTVVSGGICIVPADQLHLNFEESVQDLSGQDRHGFIYGPSNMSWRTAPNVPEGYFAAQFSASAVPQNYLQLPVFAIGGVTPESLFLLHSESHPHHPLRAPHLCDLHQSQLLYEL